MARPLRIELAGGLYHVTSRGNRRENIFDDDSDRQEWLSLLGRVCERFNWLCHAYCLMDNHYHVVVETAETNLSKGMRQLNGVYTQYFNRRHDRVGHVFQGRFKAILVEKDAYLLALARYVVLNPVRAGMVRVAEEWRWSSYLSMCGKMDVPSWLEVDWLLSQFSSDRTKAIAYYVNFVQGGIGHPPVWTDLKKQIYLGSDHFVNTMVKSVIKDKRALDDIPRLHHRALPKPIADYRDQCTNRNDAICAALIQVATQ